MNTKIPVDLGAFPYIERFIRQKHQDKFVCACQQCDAHIKLSKDNTAAIAHQIEFLDLPWDGPRAMCITSCLKYFCNKCGNVNDSRFEWHFTAKNLEELENRLREEKL